ncbi:hypothetical protein UFOVP510_7 [uncultured Caudovirales phage]|uniref:Uncharacterized protein n=1 Tax=uncultured Caudovirales phage TaxID=2100421 RepID=A0A6J5MPI7_9CAUD|nr:hypothetical protein UFOVP510_7 [uncultured Caudovirales phage]
MIRNKNKNKKFFIDTLTMLKQKIISLLFSASNGLMPIQSQATDQKAARKKPKKTLKTKSK